MAPPNLHIFMKTLCKELHEFVEQLGTEGTEELHDLVRYVDAAVELCCMDLHMLCDINRSCISITTKPMS